MNDGLDLVSRERWAENSRDLSRSLPTIDMLRQPRKSPSPQQILMKRTLREFLPKTPGHYEKSFLAARLEDGRRPRRDGGKCSSLFSENGKLSESC